MLLLIRIIRRFILEVGHLLFGTDVNEVVHSRTVLIDKTKKHKTFS